MLDIMDHDIVLLVYRNPDIPVGLDIMMKDKWGNLYIPYNEIVISIAVNLDDKLYLFSVSDNKVVTKQMNHVLEDKSNLYCIIVKKHEETTFRTVYISDSWHCNEDQGDKEDNNCVESKEADSYIKNDLRFGITPKIVSCHVFDEDFIHSLNALTGLKETNNNEYCGTFFLYDTKIYIQYQIQNNNFVTVKCYDPCFKYVITY